ncbi:MAG: Mth938-like domain-containing protein [Pseudobdellovibrionaceae bacterium]
MDVTPLIRSDQQVIQAYAGETFKVSGKTYQGAILVRPDATTAWDAPAFEDLQPQDFTFSEKDRPDVILLGVGKLSRFLTREQKQAFASAGIHIEVMDTGAACRTYNVLMAEGRLVAAALYPYL